MEIWQVFAAAFVLFLILGLPYLKRYMPYIREHTDVSDPLEHPIKEEENKGNPKLLMIRAIEIYGIFLVIMFLLYWFVKS